MLWLLVWLVLLVLEDTVLLLMWLFVRLLLIPLWLVDTWLLSECCDCWRTKDDELVLEVGVLKVEVLMPPVILLETLGDLARETVTSSPAVPDVNDFFRDGELTTVSRLEPSGKLAILASSSCSCWRALTKAAFNLFVCSCFNAFLTLLVTHCSHITRTSLPEIKENIRLYW